MQSNPTFEEKSNLYGELHKLSAELLDKAASLTEAEAKEKLQRVDEIRELVKPNNLDLRHQLV